MRAKIVLTVVAEVDLASGLDVVPLCKETLLAHVVEAYQANPTALIARADGMVSVAGTILPKEVKTA